MPRSKKLYVTLLVLLSFVMSCNNNNTVSNVTPTTTGTVETNTCDSPTTSVIWNGERSVATTVALRGTWSDIKLIPGTNSPATVYTDVGCACIKYTFWNGNSWVTEIISAGNTTSFINVRLEFLSTGIPVVVWSTTTTTLQLAIRDSAATTSTASWTLTNLDTAGTSIRAVELKVNPNDQVAVFYTRNSAGSSHLILCESNCSSGLNYSSPSTTLGNSGTNPRSLGLGWCYSGTTYYPVVALTGANTTYGICRQGTLSNCLTGIAGWAGGALQTFTGSGANRASVQLAIDDTNADAPIRAILNNGAALARYQSAFVGGGCSAGTVAAIASGGTIAGTGANSGNAYLILERDSTNNYHLIANETTTSIRYYNTTTANFTAWNAQGTVATATIGAAGATKGGLVVNETLGQAYTTFARTAAAAPFNGNLTLGWIDDITLASNSALAEFYETPITLDGQLQMTASQIPNLSVGATSTGIPGGLFVDYSTNSATVGVLKYGIRSGTSASDTWNFFTVPIVARPQNVSLIYDINDKPWIGFYDQLTLRFFVATNSSTDGTGIWSTYSYPFQTPLVAATAPSYNSISLAFDKSVTPATLVAVVGIARHATVPSTGIWSARLNTATGVWSNLVQIESTNLINSNSDVTTDYDSSGNIVVAYYDRSANNRVEYSHSLDGGITWSTPTNVTVFTAQGMGAKIKLNPATSRPAITYYDRANNRVYYSYCTTALASCSSLTNWSYSFPENFTAGVSGLAATSEGLLNTGLTFTEAGDAYIMYPVGAGNTGVLALNTTSDNSFGLSSTLFTGPNANLTTNTAMSAINFAQPGWNIDSVRTSIGSLHSIYIGPGNWLYATSCEN